MSGHYLLQHATRIPQCRAVRRNGAVPSGVVVLHTAENATDFQGADSGAEAVARFIATRSDPGSYHVLVDADSTIPLAPWSYECWHDTRTNNHAVGISAAVRSADWPRLGDRGERAVVRMALAAREYASWLHATRGITIPARRVTRAQALARVPGFIGHGEIDTGRRTDPGRDFPWDLFLAVYATPTLAASHGVIGADLPTVPGLTSPAPLTPTRRPLMRVIVNPSRGYAVVGPGYRYGLPNMEQVNVTTTLYGDAVSLSDYDWDLAWAMAVVGQDAGAVDVQALAAAVAKALPAGQSPTVGQIADELARRLDA